ncbi:MAG: recombination regulator RecX [Lachnospiraceae bacterium]|nr:recombination regulator RecX [Lachnospiraceae bacterium]
MSGVRIVTGISEMSKSRVKIEIDGEFAFVLYKGELCTYGIKEGEALSDEHYEALMQEILPRQAKLRAMNLLKSRSYTRAQLLNKLLDGGYPAELAKSAVEYTESFGYVDDEQYVRDFIEYNKERKTRQRMLTDLMNKGISKQLFEQIFDEEVGEDSAALERKQIKEWVRKKNFSVDEASANEARKMTAFLYRKGFSFDSIRSVLSLDITSI